MMKTRILLILFLLSTTIVYSLDIQKDIIEKGSQLIGTPYRSGGLNPSGFDCSGLVNYLYKPLIPSLPRTANSMSRFGSTIPLYEIKSGDLVFYATGQDNAEITHVGIYIGQNTLMQAVSDGPQRGVILTDLSEKYWKDRFKWVKRVLPQENKTEMTMIEIEFNKGNYIGTAINNEPEGEGKMFLDNGNIYTGQFHNGLFHGLGEYRYSNGDIYVGKFENGRESGGEIVRSDGSRYNAVRNINGDLSINNRIEKDNHRINYLIETPTNWDDWFQLEMEQFKVSRETEQDALKLEQERFEEWKKNN
jgi:hypothetical protein